jgi:diguanylate cyclase (GGDEF)-like protein/PAS domain S-box-containing protein
MTDAQPSAHLLIVDDDFLLRGMAAKTLRHAGFEVTDAASGEDGLALFEERAYDLVLLDVMMPGLNGYEVCRELRASAQGARVPVLMLTGLNDTESIELAYRHGATDFITKPINWTLLSHRVRYALRASIAAESMRRSREGLARAQRLAAMGNWVEYLDGRLDCSAEMLRLLGMPAEASGYASSAALLAHVVEPDRSRVERARSQLVNDGTPYQLEFGIRRSDGAVRTVFEQAGPIIDDRGHQTGIEGITQDITDRVQAQQRIRQLAHYDVTTGLPNRQFFTELAGPSLALAKRQGTLCAVLHVDIDRFKGVNDAFGRARGDEVLRTLAERLRTWTRGADLTSSHAESVEHSVLGRVGGNAFTLLITDLASQEQAGAVAQRLSTVVGQPISAEAQLLVLTASIGIAIYPNDAADIGSLTRCAEQAAYAAKSAGRAQLRFFDEQMNEQAASRSLMESELRRAIAQDELLLHFQPKVDASCGRIVGAEALVRWQHPHRGLVPPLEFIALAEDSGLIVALTDWVLESACRHLREWRDAGLPAVPLSVNLAASSLTDTALVDKLGALMRRFCLTPECVTLEVTETMLMRDVEGGVAMLERLRALGYGLSLDDFGTGYSSLSYLKRFPMHELKIDRAFITDATRCRRDGALATAIIALGRELGLSVVAEGVETAEQKTFLLGQGCNVQQGYLFSRPVPAQLMRTLLRDMAGTPAVCQAPTQAVLPVNA